MSPLRHAMSPSKLCPLREPDHRSLGSVVEISQVPICFAHHPLPQFFHTGLRIPWASLVAQRVKHLPIMWETWVQSLSREDPLEKEMGTPLVLLPGKSHGRRSLVGYSPWGRKESDMTERLHFH